MSHTSEEDGYAAWVAAGRGALVAGLDASENLIQVARARAPDADFSVGDMFALPFPDGGFDVGTSFNGIWSGCEAALVEARRVLRDEELRKALAPFDVDGIGIRLANEFGFITGTRV